MGFRFQRRIKLLPGLYLNASKSGLSTSARLGPVTVNSRSGVSVRTGVTGLSYRENLNTASRQPAKPAARRQAPRPQPSASPLGEPLPPAMSRLDLHLLAMKEGRPEDSPYFGDIIASRKQDS